MDAGPATPVSRGAIEAGASRRSVPRRAASARSRAGPSRPLRVGMMVDLYAPYVSGVTHSVGLCRRALEDAGHQVYVFTFGPPAPGDDAGVLRSPCLPARFRYGGTDVRLGLWHSAERQRQLRSMDVLHVHHPFVSGRLALRYRRGPQQPVVFTSHTRYDLHADAYLPPGLRAAGRRLLLAHLRSFCQRCDRVLAPTEGMRARLREWGVSRPIEVVALGLDLEQFQASPARDGRGSTAPAHCGADGEPGRVVATFVGRLGPEKNLEFLLESFANVAASRPRLTLVVAGDGPRRRDLEARAAALSIDDRVRFTGLVPYEAVPWLLRAADFFVTPSLTEVQPLSVLEAMAAGLPVLGLESAGVGELVQEDVTGYLATDRSSFESAMARLADDDRRRRTMGAAARRAGGQYSIEATVSSLVTCYQSAIQSAQQVPHCSL